MKKGELIGMVNNSDVSLDSLLELEFEIGGINDMLVKSGLDMEFHKKYSIATNVYKCDDGYVGIRGVYETFGDSDFEEADCPCMASEFKNKDIDELRR